MRERGSERMRVKARVSVRGKGEILGLGSLASRHQSSTEETRNLRDLT